MMERLSTFEYRAIETIASNDRDRNALLAQLAAANCASRDYTGIGMYVELFIPPTVPKLDSSRCAIEDMPKGYAEHPEVPAGAGLILWLKDGLIDCLECYTYDGNWPDDESLIRVTSQ